MYTYTTPTITCILDGVDFSQVDYVRVAVESKKSEIVRVVPVMGRFTSFLNKARENRGCNGSGSFAFLDILFVLILVGSNLIRLVPLVNRCHKVERFRVFLEPFFMSLDADVFFCPVSIVSVFDIVPTILFAVVYAVLVVESKRIKTLETDISIL